MSDGQILNPFSRRLNIRDILSNSPPPLDHVLPGLLAGTVGMLVGPGGIGKTMFELQVALAVACGGSICGGLFDKSRDEGDPTPPNPGRVVLALAEESAEVVAHRLHAVIANAAKNKHLLGVDASPSQVLEMWDENLHIYPLADCPRLELMDRDLMPTESFRQLLGACDGARLVIVDPIRQFHSCDENQSGPMTALVQTMRGIPSSSKCALILAQHASQASVQSGQGGEASAGRGSTALTDGVRWQLNLHAPTNGSARDYGIAQSDLKRFVLVDLPKANYMAPTVTEVLERLPGGVLTLAGTSMTEKPVPGKGASPRQPRTTSKSERT